MVSGFKWYKSALLLVYVMLWSVFEDNFWSVHDQSAYTFYERNSIMQRIAFSYTII